MNIKNDEMIMLLSEIINEMPEQELNKAELAIDNMFRELGLDVIFTQHFKNRILDGGSEERDSDVTAQEIFRAFNALKIQYGKQLLDASHNASQFVGVLRDVTTKLNMPFSIDYDKIYKGLHKLKVITIMRKSNFGSDNYKSKVLTVRSTNGRA